MRTEKNVLDKEKFTQTIRWLTVLLSFVIPLSNSLTTILSVVIVLFFLWGISEEQVMDILHNKLLQKIIFFWLLYVIGCFYSVGEFSDIVTSLRKVSKLLLMPILYLYFYEDIWKKRVLVSFCLGTTLLLFMGVGELNKCGWKEAVEIGITFRDSISVGLFIAFSGIIMICFAAHERKKICAFLFFVVGVVSFTYVMFFLKSRTAQIISVFFLVFLFLCFYKIKKRSVLLTFVLIVCVFSCLESSMRARGKEAFREVSQYWRIGKSSEEKQVKLYNETSVGIRIFLLENSWQIIKERPWGWGTGAFAKKHDELLLKKYGKIKKHSNPHNQFLLILIDVGILGLIAFVVVLSHIWKECSNVHKVDDYSLLCKVVIVALVVGSLANSWLLDFSTMHFFSLFLAVLVPKAAKKRLLKNAES